MNHAFKEALEKRRILPYPGAKELVQKEMRMAADDLAEAVDRFNSERYKYATINAYYSIFHSARALLYSKGYREKSHFALYIAIEALFVETGSLEKRYSRLLTDTMALREEADYSGNFSKEGASLSIDNAKDFIKTAKKLLSK